MPDHVPRNRSQRVAVVEGIPGDDVVPADKNSREEATEKQQKECNAGQVELVFSPPGGADSLLHLTPSLVIGGQRQTRLLLPRRGQYLGHKCRQVSIFPRS